MARKLWFNQQRSQYLGRTTCIRHDPQEHELAIAHRKPGFERLFRVLRTVRGNMHPAVVSECVYGTFDGSRIAGDDVEYHVLGYLGVAANLVDFVLYLE